MSLSTWLRDYLYVPLGGSRAGATRTSLNLVATMLLGGLWHGPGWNFVLWGGAHGVLLAAERQLRPLTATLPRPFCRLLGVIYAVAAVWLLWIPFRAPNFAVTRQIFSAMFFGGGPNIWYPPATLLALGALVLWHIAHESSPRFRSIFDSENCAPLLRPVRAFVLGAATMVCIAFTNQQGSGFIYFQF
jgi:hypothetical protein